ncbi:hypothetical protein HAX54_009486 [Datura stramonium]|uniref:Uncharacterized protein n=1 Tax=Datura stramonium TaxID=4076 RepID=A0ABS8WZK6_DATST|nr:hypothetical protein [Datura stramonium]
MVQLASQHKEVRKIDKDMVKAAVENRVKAALEKRRKLQGDGSREHISASFTMRLGMDITKGQVEVFMWEEPDCVEEGELEPYDDADRGYRSPKSNSRKRKASSPQKTRWRKAT